MNLLKNGKCSSCGYPAVSTKEVRNALPPQTVLMDRLELGNALDVSFQSIAYIAFDRQEKQPVIVLEFFPKQIAARRDKQLTVRSNKENFIEACRLFLSSRQDQPLELMYAFAENNTVYRVYQPDGHAASAVDQAEKLLDNPIFFRTEQNVPKMTINALGIPQLPQKREWQLSKKLQKESKRKKIRNMLVFSVLFVVLVVAGFIVYDKLRMYDVAIWVTSSTPVREAKLNGELLPAETPQADGRIRYEARLRKGEYTFVAENEDQMNTGVHSLSVKEDGEFSMSIPTPTPAPVKLTDVEWLYAENGQLYVVKDTFVKETRKVVDTVYPVEITGDARLAKDQDNYSLLLCKGGAERELRWKNGTIQFEVSEGTYEIFLRCGDDKKLLKTFSAPAEKEISLNLQAVDFYCEYLHGLTEMDHLYYVGDYASIILDGTEAENINEWADVYPELFGKYRLYQVPLQLDSRYRDDVQVKVNQTFDWTIETEIWVCEHHPELNIELIAGDVVIPETVYPVMPEAGEEAQVIILGKEHADKAEDFWKETNGFFRIGEECFLMKNGDKGSLMTEQEINELKEYRVLFSADEENAVLMDMLDAEVALSTAPMVDRQQIVSVSLNGQPLDMSDDGRCVFAATDGVYELTITFANGLEPVVRKLEIKDHRFMLENKKQSSRYIMLEDEVKASMQLKNDVDNEGLQVVTVDEHQLFVQETALAETPDYLVRVGEVYNKQLQELFDQLPVQVSVDPRIAADKIGNIQMGVITLQMDPETRTTNLEGAMAGKYEIQVSLAGDINEQETLDVWDGGENQVVLLKRFADEQIGKLRFWGLDKENLEYLSGDTDYLTPEAVEESKSTANVYEVVIDRELILENPLTLKDKNMQKELKLANEGLAEAVVYLPEGGEFELYVLWMLDKKSYKLMDISTVRKDTLISITEKDIAVLPTPTPTSTPAPTYKPTNKPSNTGGMAKPSETPTAPPNPFTTETPKPIIENNDTGSGTNQDPNGENNASVEGKGGGQSSDESGSTSSGTQNDSEKLNSNGGTDTSGEDKGGGQNDAESGSAPNDTLKNPEAPGSDGETDNQNGE